MDELLIHLQLQAAEGMRTELTKRLRDRLLESLPDIKQGTAASAITSGLLVGGVVALLLSRHICILSTTMPEDADFSEFSDTVTAETFALCDAVQFILSNGRLVLRVPPALLDYVKPL